MNGRRLRTWLRESRGEVRLQRLVAQAAVEWEAAHREPGFLLTGARLAQIEAWQREATVALTSSERALLDASLAERDRLTRAEAARQAREIALERRARRILQALAGVLLGATMIAAGLAWWANDRRVAAQVAEQAAVSNLAMSEGPAPGGGVEPVVHREPRLRNGSAPGDDVRSINLGYSPQGDAACHARAVRPMCGAAVPGPLSQCDRHRLLG